MSVFKLASKFAYEYVPTANENILAVDELLSDF